MEQRCNLHSFIKNGVKITALFLNCFSDRLVLEYK